MAASATTDTASPANTRFVVSLPKDVGEMIDEVGAKLSEAFMGETGIAFELSRAQIVQALVRQALKAQEDGADTE
jgi:hypothetical protein